MNPNNEFERFTQRIYQKLIDNDTLKRSTVQCNVKLKGKSSCEHQIDVYWEYELDGITHRVAVECKNYSSKISIGKVRDFFGVLHDLDNVQGIMVTSKGYQKGAKIFADYYGISLKKLRRPNKDEIIGSITSVVQSDIKRILFLFDEDWVTERGLDLNRLRTFYASFQPDKAEYWKKATYFPIKTKDHIIRDSSGEIITSFDELERHLPENPEPGTEIVFPVEDGWVDSLNWGSVKIHEVKYEYENKVHETILNLVADDFVEAILEDALGERIDYIPKY